MISRNPKLQNVLDGMARSLDLTPQAHAESAGKCMFCRQPITDFRDDLSRREYQITGQCQTCQDKMEAWAEAEEEESDE